MTPTKPYHVVALHRIDGMVLLGEFDSASERDDLYRRERSIWCNGGYDSDTVDIVRGEMGTRERTAEEANVANALMAQMQLL